MPIYTVKASDGNLYKVDAPEGTTQEQVFAFVSSQMAMRQRAPESAGFNLGDLAASFAQGAYGSTQALTDVFGAGNVASQALEERARASQAGMSVARQAELARQQERLKRAEASGSTLEEIKAAVQNVAEAPLQSAAQALGSFAPYIPTMFLGPAAGVLGLGARATAAATNVAKAAPAVIGTAQGAGAVKGAIYDAVYEAERKDGVGEEEARAKAEAAQSYAGNNIDQILLGSGAGYVAGRFGAERLLTPGAAAKASQSVAGRIATAAATDVPTEAFQGGQERLAANLALQREGRDVPTFEGVAGQATQEGLLGLLGSAPVAALRGPDVEALRQEEVKRQQAEFEAEKARALEEMASRPPEPEKPIELPQGYKVMREELGREVGPESYGIFVEGQETPLTTVASEQQALQKIESFKEIRESERETLVEQMEKLNDGIQKTRDRIDYLEATGKTADPEYTKLTTALPDQELAAETKARELAEQVQQLGAPLTFAPIGQKETVREQYNVLSPTNEPIGTFATAGEAEASVRGIIGDEPFKQAEVKKERDERIVSLEQQLVPKLKQFGLQDVGLKVVESIENNAGGAYLNKLIRVAYDEANPLQTMRHESLHALKDLGFFTPQQWKALNERAEKQWVQELKNVPFSEGKSRHDAYVEMFTQEGEAKGLSGQQLQNYVRETLNEEAIADAFGAYDRGATPPPGMIAALFKQLKNFFLNFGQALRGAGFESADDIFQRVERGELRGRKPAEAEEKFSLQVANKVASQLNLQQPEIDSTSISLQTGKAGVEQFKKTPIGGLPKVVEYLEKRRLQSSLKPLDINNEEDREELAKLMAAEAMAAINAGGNALEWYDSVIDSLMQIASLKYKELATDEDMRSAFRMAIAIASQGLNVEDNLTFAMSQYDYFRNNLKFKELGSGSDGAAMKSNFILANQMIEQYTLGNLRRFLQTEFAVEELRDAGFEIGGELGDEKVTGSAIFGPKIGFGFYSNLSGNFEPVTMDMWFMRTVGRLTGKLKGFDPVKFDAQLKRFRNAFKESGEDGVYADEFKESELQKANESVEGAVNLARVVNSVFNRDFINNRELYNEGARKKSELVYAAQNIIKSYDAPKDAPQNGTERRLLRDVVARTVDKVAKAYGKRIPPASLQALIWYPEQELYKALGVKLRVTSQDYAGAIKKILTKEGYDGAAIDRAAKSGPRAVQPVAGQQVQAGVAPTGKKPQTAFEPAEREEFLEERRTERVVKQEREAPRRKKVIFEVAPDPNDVDLANSWRNLPQEERLNISEEIAKKIIARSKSDLDFDGRIVSQVGSYLDDTNPSFALFLESGDSVEIAKYLGFSLSQDSMMVVSPKPGKGLEEVGAVVVDVGTQAPSKINDIYQSLREIRVNGNQPVGGQTTMNNKMIILNYSDVPTEELANLIDQKLGGNYDVEPTTVYSAFPEKVSYDYASEENDPRGKGKIVRERARSLRAEATELLRQALGGEGKAAAKTGDKKYSLRAPTSPNFKRWFGDSKIVNEDGTPMVMYHGTRQDFAEPNTLGNRGAFFVSPDANFANKYALNDLDWYPDKKGFGPIEEGAQVYPVYISAKNPFDYENDSHMVKIIPQFRKVLKEEEGYNRAQIEELIDDFRKGKWSAIEWANDYGLFEKNGFDAFYTKEQGRKNLGVFKPQQVKSAIGNFGTYSSEEPDIRFSLKAPTSTAFKQWFGDSTVVNEDGTPKVMYHGLAKDTTDFTRKTARGAPIFLTDDPEFAAQFSADSYESVARNPQEYLSKEQIDDGVKRAIAAIKKDYGKDFLGKEMVESLQTGDLKDATPEAREYIQKEFINLLPTGPHIMPLYVRAERPFDYQNPSHIRKVLAELTEDAYDPAEIRSGSWELIESADFQDAIQSAGFDSFYVKEQGRKNLAVYDPNQVKSATGNVGTFSRESADVRYSLKNVAFSSAKEAQEAADAKQAPNTKEFKLFIGASRWLDEDGNPKKFFHATAGNFFEFLEGRIYLSETAKDSEKYGYGAEDRLRASIYRALNKDEKLPLFQRAVDEAVKEGKITAEDGNEFMRQVKRKIPDFGKYNAIKEEVDAELIALSPERMKIMPLYARSETPFDFRNSEHVYQVSSIVDRGDVRLSEEAIQEARRLGVPSEYPDQWYRGLPGLIKQGYPKTIESPQVQKAIRKLGFDGYIVRHNRNAPLTYVVYDNNQVKSVTGNLGDYSLETKDIRYSLKNVRYSDNRFEKLWNESMYTQNDAENKTKGYLAFVDPMDFVRATASPETFERLLQEQEPLDPERMRNYDQVPFLSVSEKNGEWKITGHEGRHRMLALHGAGYNEVPIYIHLRAEDAKSIPVKMLTAQYPDSVSSVLMAAEVEPLSYANKDKAMEKFTRMSSKVKYSLPAIPKAMETRIGETTFRREPERFFERITEAISPKNFSYFRQRVLNQYNQLGVYDKKLVEQMGGKELLADQRAEAAALMSDLGAGVAASAMGFGDRNGGIPVYKNGVTTIDRSKKGLIAVLQPLARYGDPKIYQYYQYWAMVKRGVRLNAEGIVTGIDNTDVQYAKYLQDKFPEFVTVQKEFIEFNNGLVKYARDTGVISEQNAEAFMRHADYVPFYRQMDGETTVGPNIFQSIAGVKPPKKLKGGTAPLADFLETAVRNTQSMIQAGVKNAAAQRAVGVVTKVKAPGMGAERLDYDANGPDVFHVLENGKRVSYRTPDVLLIDAISSLHLNEIPGLGIIAAPANALRNLVTKDPGFMMANLMRDSLSAWVTSGQKMTPIAGTVINFGKALAKKSKGYEALLDAGVIGGYEFSQNIERSGRQLEEDLSEKAGKKAPLALRPFKSLWGALERGTEASDAATRALVYERVLNDTGNEAEALFRALEVMNFNRKGNSPLIRILTAGVPFLNARMQGLDLFYRASTGNMNMADKAAIKRQFWLRGSSIFAISAIYWMMVHDEDDYKSQEQETKDNNWIIPSLGIRIPIPFEVGVLFKTIPERIMAYSFGNDTGKDFMESMKRNFMSTFAFNPIPQVVKPVLEAAFNFNPFTWRQIVGQGMQDVAVEYQVGPGTSKIAKAIGENLGLSPMKVDHIIKGYTGTMGMYAIDTIDYIMDQFGDSPKAAKRFEQMPVIKRFAVDPAARGTVTAYYELKDSVDTTVRTMNLLERTMEPEKFAQYVQDNLGPLAVKDYIRDLEKTMKELREMRVVIQSSTMSAEEKRDGLLTINQAENNLTKNIQEVKKAIASLK